jgi:hypothetical protein
VTDPERDDPFIDFGEARAMAILAYGLGGLSGFVVASVLWALVWWLS